MVNIVLKLTLFIFYFNVTKMTNLSLKKPQLLNQNVTDFFIYVVQKKKEDVETLEFI